MKIVGRNAIARKANATGVALMAGAVKQAQ